ncbi:MAG: hypothetical protein BWX50_01048 [Euryarchaeota archaeon ADurb.Bin009]|nr:MAG: hypothetical protein BWX50_01048 [Euryarchaeota archaeon ADurb.Bin009]
MPRIDPASMSCRVMLISWVEGSRVPEGWLWTSMTDAARSVIASAKTSRGWTRLWFRIPMVTTRRLITSPAPLSVMQKKYSCFLSRHSLTSGSTSSGLVIRLPATPSSSARYRRPSSKQAMISQAFAAPMPSITRRASYEGLPLALSRYCFTSPAICETSRPFTPRPRRRAISSALVSDWGPRAASFSRGRSWSGISRIFFMLIRPCEVLHLRF